MGLRSSCCTKGCLPCELESQQHQIQPLKVTAFWTYPKSCKKKTIKELQISKIMRVCLVYFQNIFMDLYLFYIRLHPDLHQQAFGPPVKAKVCFYPVKTRRCLRKQFRNGGTLAGISLQTPGSFSTECTRPSGNQIREVKGFQIASYTCIDYMYVFYILYMPTLYVFHM